MVFLFQRQPLLDGHDFLQHRHDHDTVHGADEIFNHIGDDAYPGSAATISRLETPISSAAKDSTKLPSVMWSRAAITLSVDSNTANVNRG